MNVLEIEQATAEAKARAEELAAGFEARAQAAGATEADRLNAETAKTLIQIGEMRAKYVPRDFLDQHKAELAVFEDEMTDSLTDKARAMIVPGVDKEREIYAALQEGAAQAVASLDVRREAVMLALAQHSLDAWLLAVDELAALDRPLSPFAATEAREQ